MTDTEEETGTNLKKLLLNPKRWEDWTNKKERGKLTLS